MYEVPWLMWLCDCVPLKCGKGSVMDCTDDIRYLYNCRYLTWWLVINMYYPLLQDNTYFSERLECCRVASHKNIKIIPPSILFVISFAPLLLILYVKKRDFEFRPCQRIFNFNIIYFATTNRKRRILLWFFFLLLKANMYRPGWYNKRILMEI